VKVTPEQAKSMSLDVKATNMKLVKVKQPAAKIAAKK